MKYIFDFDDVLLHTTKMFKRQMYNSLENAGINREDALEYYRKTRGQEFSLRNFITELLKTAGKDTAQTEKIYEEIMSKCPNFTNVELVNKISTMGKENCFIVTNGDGDFQSEKIKRSGISHLFQEVFVVPGSKQEAIYNICSKYKDDKVFFVDDKTTFFNDIDFNKCPNLETVLYTP
jgi:FMN phosphatase YigB (HAD superfamily)